MAVTAGTISLVQRTASTVKLAVTAATLGTGPYTYQWYRSQTTGFSPGGGNIIAGATALTLSDSGLIPNSTYFYKNVVTDTGDSNVTATAAQLAVVTLAPSPNINQFAQSPLLGMLDLRLDYDTISAQVDSTQATPLYAGMAVKVVNNGGGVPKVVSCAADADNVFGFINYNIKNQIFLAGDALEISQAGNVMWMYASAAIVRGARVALNTASPGTVKPLAGSGGADIVGWAVDQATAYGQLIRVRVLAPSFLKDA